MRVSTVSWSAALGGLCVAALACAAHPTPPAPAQTGAPVPAPPSTPSLTHGTPFGRTRDGAAVEKFTLKGRGDLAVDVITFGAAVTSMRVPSRDGRVDDVVLGYDDVAGYEVNKPHFGGVVGRVANRIANGKFSLDGRPYSVTVNDGPNSLHGGERGFDRRLWTTLSASEHAVTLRYVSVDGEEGYPGTLTVTVTYTLDEADVLGIQYVATADRATPVNLTNHSYFNLAGAGAGDVLDHVVTIQADAYTPVDANLIPTGAVMPVAGTPYDFLSPTPVGARIAQIPGGFDLNYVLRGKADGRLLHAASVVEPRSGRRLGVLTTEPGLQFYTGNFLDGSVRGKRGIAYPKHGGLCLEAQHFPDAVNHPTFPGVVVRPGEAYKQTTIYSFSW